jgi:hypothetical protein
MLKTFFSHGKLGSAMRTLLARLLLERKAAIVLALVCAWTSRASAEDPTQWLSSLPTVAAVQKSIQGSDPADTALRQDAAFAVLLVFIPEYGGIKRAPISGTRYGEYQSHIPRDTYKANKYFRSADFIASTVSTLISPEASRSFQRQLTFRQIVSSNGTPGPAPRAAAPAPRPTAPPPPWVQTDVARARDAHVDLAVFGIQLGERLNLPSCGDSSGRALFSGLVGIGRGGAETCIGDTAGDAAIAAAQMLGALIGAKPAPDGADQVSVGLADSKCPMWLKTGGNCMVVVRTNGGVVVSVAMTPGVDGDAQRKAAEELARKYGPPDPGGPTVRCTAPVTAQGYATDGTLMTAQVGADTHEATGRSWSRVPGLHVSYSPIAATCRSGLIEVDLGSYHQLNVVSRAQNEANEPRL